MYAFLSNVMHKLEMSNAGRFLLRILKTTKIEITIRNISCYYTAHKRYKYPTLNMLCSKEYFENNEHRISEISSWLNDETSKNVFKKIIEFRYKSNIKDFPPSSSKRGYSQSQYYYNSIFSYSQDEVYIDCGAYIGETIKNFEKAMSYFNGGYSKIVAFEPDVFNCKVLNRRYKQITVINAGMWCENTVLPFYMNGSQGSSLVQLKEINNNVVSIPVVSIDTCPDCIDATFIKMDIEGAELQALKGAESIIKKNKPKLAISIYHSNEDMLNIVEWVHKTVPEYKLFVRHHSFMNTYDTVLYATL